MSALVTVFFVFWFLVVGGVLMQQGLLGILLGGFFWLVSIWWTVACFMERMGPDIFRATESQANAGAMWAAKYSNSRGTRRDKTHGPWNPLTAHSIRTKKIRCNKVRSSVLGPCERTATKQGYCSEHQPGIEEHRNASRKEKSVHRRSWTGSIPKPHAKRLLIDRFGAVCWGCGITPKRSDGRIDEGLLEVDHLRAKKSVQGKSGSDELFNLGILDRTCNRIKSNKMTIEELRKHNRLNEQADIRGFVDLYEAQEFAFKQLATRAFRR